MFRNELIQPNNIILVTGESYRDVHLERTTSTSDQVNTTINLANVSFTFSAVVLDRQYLGDKYQAVLDELKDYIKELARVELQHGGVIVHYYSWTAINLKRGINN